MAPENSAFWNTVATVAPVLALSIVVIHRRDSLKSKKLRFARWMALGRIVRLALLAICEYAALSYLSRKTSDGNFEALAVFSLGATAITVLLDPIVPQILLARLGFSRDYSKIEREFSGMRRETSQIRKLVEELRETARFLRREGSYEISEARIEQSMPDHGRGVRPRADSLMNSGKQKFALAERFEHDLTEAVNRIEEIERKIAKNRERYEDVVGERLTEIAEYYENPK